MKILAEMSDGWGPFLASSNAQLLDVRQIEAFKDLVDAQTENDAEGIKAAEQELAELKARSGMVGQAGYCVPPFAPGPGPPPPPSFPEPPLRPAPPQAPPP